jgi:hypothetical protein
MEYDLRLFFGKASQFNRKRSNRSVAKKYQGSDIILPTRVMCPKEALELAVYVDRSQSFKNDEKTIAAESVFQKHALMKNVSLRVFHFDTQVAEYDYKRTPDIVPKMGGLTAHNAVFEHINENKFRNIAIITDYDDGNGKIPPCVEAAWFCIIRLKHLMLHGGTVTAYAPPISRAATLSQIKGRLISVWLHEWSFNQTRKSTDHFNHTSKNASSHLKIDIRRIFRGILSSSTMPAEAFYVDYEKHKPVPPWLS